MLAGLAWLLAGIPAVGVAAQGLPHVDPGAPQAYGARPNVLLVVADDLGVDRVGAYGEHPDPGHTPVIDALAASGVVFRNAWSNPTCSPTRATILTGRYSCRTGIGRSIDHDGGDFELPVGAPSLARAGASRTSRSRRRSTAPRPGPPPTRRPTRWTTPWPPSAMVEAMDTEIGRLLGSLPPPVAARTLVIFVGDNGTPGEATTPPFVAANAKTTPFEGGINVPLVVAGPGVAAGAECDALVNTTDLFATIVELTGAGGGAGAGTDSVSLVPYLSQPGRPSLRSWVYAESFGPNGPPPWATHTRTVREARYKLIEVGAAGGGTQSTLFDLDLDPFERTDLLSGGPLDAGAQAAHDFLAGVLAGLR